jgi:transposase
MKYVGVDLHKQLIVLCVVAVVDGKRQVVCRSRLSCQDEARIEALFAELGPFEVAVEATSAYDWFVELVEPLASRIVLVNPRKMRIIAESRRKTDKLDAQILAEFLAADELPQAWRPTPRVRCHRTLVRQLDYLRRKTSGLKCRLRNLLARYNADIRSLFTDRGAAHMTSVHLNSADRFVAQQLWAALEFQHQQRLAICHRMRQFAKAAPIAEREARAVLESVPCLGPVTLEVLLSELGDVRRFDNQNQVVQYAGLAPGIRESAGHRKDQSITKEGSPLLRWTMIQLAWRLVNKSRRWSSTYEGLKHRCGPKKAIVAIARRVLCVLVSLLRSGQRYNLALDGLVFDKPRPGPQGRNQRPQVPPPHPHLLPSSL